ncbi:MAG: bifunctional glutamate N-acetyltransferase/amino-acid acetyltransferase ArgJ [Rhodobacteraceae bacterium]|nr:bifunctional glutamate N-acetyltransferase/amino-acid acetyltransferase ArgJ [Paracoccaceae bacterium]
MNPRVAVSPLAPAAFPDLPIVGGVECATFAAGIKRADRADVALMRLAAGTSVAGVFTRSATRSAAVRDCQAKIAAADAHSAAGGAAIVVNSGNANTFTGAAGEQAVAAMTRATAACLNIDPRRVFSCSTGVIGEPLPHERILAGLPAACAALRPGGLRHAAEAIRTTDTFAKGAGVRLVIKGRPVHIAGIAKGSGMVAPNMATMLAYLFTDAQVARPLLQTMLVQLNACTFNRITVEGDTSTSDTVLLAATGAAGVRVAADSDSDTTEPFRQALHAVMRDLAHQVVRDGEGATKFVEIRVMGAASDEDAHIHARAVAQSPLVKTALAGEDANWGRIVMALGKSGAALQQERLRLHLGDILIAENGAVAAGYSEDRAAAYMKRKELHIAVDLGLAQGEAVVWTCDLTHDYITINAGYRS